MKNAMKKFGQCLLVATMSLGLASTAMAGVQDFTLHNETGVEIHEVYVAPSKSDDWEEDILGDDTLADGESVDITFNDRQKVSKWDILIKDEDGNSIEWDNLNLTEISAVTLHYKKGKAWADVE